VNAANKTSSACDCAKSAHPEHSFHCRVCGRGVTGLPPRDALAAERWFAAKGLDASGPGVVCVTCKSAPPSAPPASGVRPVAKRAPVVCVTSDELIEALSASIDDAQIGVGRPATVVALDPHERSRFSFSRRSL